MSFKINNIHDTIVNRMKAKSIWLPDCPVAIKDLRLLELEHYDFNQNINNGQMVVFYKLAENVISIFQELLAQKFPIDKIKLIDEYDGDDNLSMKDNNSSSFNYRKIAGSDIISMHSYGLAIDINPVQNPYLIIGDNNHNTKSIIDVYPAKGSDYLNRHNQRMGMVEPIVGIFKKYGFNIWGGEWNSPIDYHHFQVDRSSLNEILER